MLRKCFVFGVGIACWVIAAQARSAAFDIVVTRDPAPTGSLYSWSLRMSAQPGFAAGAIGLMATGDSDFQFNTTNPAISLVDSLYLPAAEFDGVESILILSAAYPAPLVSGPASDVLLGRYLSPFSSTPAFNVLAGDDILGFTVISPLGDIAYPPGVFSIRVVPEPGTLLLGLVAAVAVGLSRRRVTPAARVLGLSV